MELIYLDTASDDLIQIEAYVSDMGSRRAALSVVESLQVRCERIASLSGTLGTDRSKLRPGMRSTPHHNYIIFFRYSDEALEIVNILHASRDVAAHYDAD